MTDADARPTLVLGGGGFLGAHVTRAALREGDAPVAVAGRSRSAAVPAGARFERLDAEAPRELEALLDRLRPARVLCAAAAASALACEERPDEARRLNAELPARLARWCAARGARLVHVSTDLVFGARPAPRGGFREEDPPAPLGVYGRTKAEGERAVLELAPAALVARLPLLFGDSFGRGRGASDALVAALERGERPALFVDEWRTPLAVEDAAEALVELARGDARGLLHVAGPERVGRHELGLLALRARGLGEAEARSRVEAATRATYAGPPRAEDVCLDARRARGLLGVRLRGPSAALRTDDAG